MKVILDGMGGDNAPFEIVKGAVLAAGETDAEICITGRETEINAELKKYDYNKDQISVRNAEEVITMHDAPVKAIRKKKDSSMVAGMNMVKDGEGDLFVSAGSTGALLAGGIFILGRIKGVDRPAIASVYPILGTRKPSLLVDAGANSECKPGNLLQFGVMGSIYMDKVLERPDPKVALVNIGEEDSKGNALTKAAYSLLTEANINFTGNIEARDVPKGKSDVIVCDGFTGNVILKLTEGLAWNIMKMLKTKFTDGVRAKIGALFLMNKMKEIGRETDYSEYGGAPILGVRGPVIKMHGSSKSNAVKNTILKAIPYARQNVVSIIEKEAEKFKETTISET